MMITRRLLQKPHDQLTDLLLSYCPFMWCAHQLTLPSLCRILDSNTSARWPRSSNNRALRPSSLSLFRTRLVVLYLSFKCRQVNTHHHWLAPFIWFVIVPPFIGKWSGKLTTRVSKSDDFWDNQTRKRSTWNESISVICQGKVDERKHILETLQSEMFSSFLSTCVELFVWTIDLITCIDNDYVCQISLVYFLPRPGGDVITMSNEQFNVW